MSFEKVDTEKFFWQDEQFTEQITEAARLLLENIRSNRSILKKSYAEIDRLNHELDISRQSNADSAKEADELRARVDELERQNANLLQLANGALQPADPELVWKCPVSWVEGEYKWSDDTIATPFDSAWCKGNSLRAFRDWADPPRQGIWKVVEPGKAVWVRE